MLDRGAGEEQGELYFDRKLQMVRSKKKGNSGDSGRSKKKESAG